MDLFFLKVCFSHKGLALYKLFAHVAFRFLTFINSIDILDQRTNVTVDKLFLAHPASLKFKTHPANSR